MEQFIEDEQVTFNDPVPIFSLVMSCDQEKLENDLNDTTILHLIKYK